MNLRILGSIHDRGAFAPFDYSHGDLPFLLGKEVALAVPDTRIGVREVGDDFIRFDFIRFDKVEEILLHIGESKEYRHEGNAYGYKIQFVLEA